MPATDDTADFNNACTACVRSTVSAIPSILERLIFLASLREPDTGEYHDQVLEARFAGLLCAKAELDRALRHEHRAVFEDWLCLDIRHQTEEMERYASNRDIPPPTFLRTWIDEKSYERLVPSGAMPPQRQLFLSDMEAAVAALSTRTFWDEVQ
jgi:hypothetical protein